MGQHETILQPMSDEVFAEYLEGAIASYAKSNVDSGNWPADEALEYSRADHDKLLPQGAQTPDHYLFEIKEAPKPPPVPEDVAVSRKGTATGEETPPVTDGEDMV